MPLPISDK